MASNRGSFRLVASRAVATVATRLWKNWQRIGNGSLGTTERAQFLVEKTRSL